MAGGEEDFIVLNPEEGVFLDCDEFFSWLFDWKSFRGFSFAEIPDRADETGGGAWGAKSLAELHESGVEEAGVSVIQKVTGIFPNSFLSISGVDRQVLIEESGNYASDVAINNG